MESAPSVSAIAPKHARVASRQPAVSRISSSSIGETVRCVKPAVSPSSRTSAASIASATARDTPEVPRSTTVWICIAVAAGGMTSGSASSSGSGSGSVGIGCATPPTTGAPGSSGGMSCAAVRPAMPATQATINGKECGRIFFAGIQRPGKLTIPPHPTTIASHLASGI
jgi:hypothetical protein